MRSFGEHETHRRHCHEQNPDRQDPKQAGDRVLADTLVGDGGDTLCGDVSGCLVFIDGVVNVVVGASK